MTTTTTRTDDLYKRQMEYARRWNRCRMCDEATEPYAAIHGLCGECYDMIYNPHHGEQDDEEEA